MTEERKNELFNEFINYLCGLDPEICVDILVTLGVTRAEAEELEFYDFITEKLPDSYE